MQRLLLINITFLILLPTLLFSQTPYLVKDSVANEDPIFSTFNVEVNVASKTASNLDDTPGIVTVIDRSQIDFTNARTLSDIVRMIPGFDFSRVTIGFGEPIEGFYARGIPSDLSQTILFLLNGRNKLNDFSFSGPWIAHKINVDMIERIEVIRGPGSALYGGNAFTAVINIVTRDQNTRPESLFEVTYGTHNYVSAYGLTRQNIGGWILGIQAKYFQDEGRSYESLNVDKYFGRTTPLRESYLITDGMNPSYDFSINLQDAKRKFRIQAWHTFHDPHPMLAGYYPTPNNGNYYYRAQQTMFNLNYTPIENLNISADVTLMKWNWRTLAYDDSTLRVREITYLEDDLLGAEQNNRQFQTDVNYTFFLGGGEQEVEGEKKLQHEILVGASFSLDGQHDAESILYDTTSQQEVKITNPDNSRAFYPDFTRTQASVYTQDTWQVNQRLALTAGLRLDYYDDIGFNFNPRFAAVLDLDQEGVNKLKVLYGEGFRPPGGFELKGIKLGPLKGTPNLNPEKIRTAEIAYITYLRRNFLDLNTKRDVLRIQLSGYYSDVQDAIFTVNNTDADSTIIPLKYANIGEREVYGLEAEMKAKYWWANYSYVFSQSTLGDGETVDRTPFLASHHFNAGVQIPLFKDPTSDAIKQQEDKKRFDGINGLYFSSQFFYRSGRLNGTHEGKKETTAYYEWDAKLLYYIANLEINFGVRNLLDRAWAFPLNDEGGYELPYRGREFVVKAVIHIQ